MLSVITKTENDINSIVMSLLHEYTLGKTEMENLIKKAIWIRFYMIRYLKLMAIRRKIQV